MAQPYWRPAAARPARPRQRGAGAPEGPPLTVVETSCPPLSAMAIPSALTIAFDTTPPDRVNIRPKWSATTPEATPACAAIAGSTLFGNGAVLSSRLFNLIGVEAEIGYCLGRDLPPRPEDYSLDEVRSAIESVHPVIELSDTRFVAWASQDRPSHVADQLNHGALAVGAGSTESRDPFAQRAIMTVNGDVRADTIGGNPAGDLSRLRDLEIGIAGGNNVPLAQIATFDYGLEETIIWRRDRLPTITVQSKVKDGLTPATVNKQLDQDVLALMAKLPPGYRIEVGGAAGESAKGSASIVAVIPVMFIIMLFILIRLDADRQMVLR